MNRDRAPILRYREVTKHYNGTPAVDRLSLDLLEGETLVLVGPSGCGKTTTLKMANRLVVPSAGSIEVFGTDLERWNCVELRRSIGYVIQQIGLLPHMTVAENMGLLARLRGWPKAKIQERIDELLALIGLPQEQFREKYHHELSGGQAQRVGVARALMLSPRILLMDEPFGALDPITRREVQTEFRSFARRVSTSILLVTHDMVEAFRLGDRIAVMDRGKLAQVGTPEEIRKAPKASFVRDFFDASQGLLGPA